MAGEETVALLADCETPSSSSRDLPTARVSTPLPKLQISTILLLQVCEPITSRCIHPFINQLVGELDIIGGDKRKVGYYVGLIESLFFAAHFLTVLPWSHLSDRVGRKPIVLIGLSGICVSTICFGLSRTFWGLVLSRCLSGLLNGNISVIKALIGEVTDKSNMAQGFALLPITWCVGATIGPFLGGSLSRPHETFPQHFSGQFWKTYPYFLPCAVSGGFPAIAFFVALLFLKEPVHGGNPAKEAAGFRAAGNITLQGVTGGATPGLDEPVVTLQSNEDPVPLRELFAFPIFITITNYVLLSFLDIAKASLVSLFLSTAIEFGGLGLSPPMIGLVLGLYGLSGGIVQALFFSAAVRRWGPKRVFVCGMAALLPAYALFPVMSSLAKSWGLSPFVWVALMVQTILAIVVDMAYGCMYMFITAVAPNKRALGATYGLSQTSVSIARATGPGMSTSLFAFSVQHNVLGGHGVYIVFICLTCFSLVFTAWLPDGIWIREGEEE